MSPELRTPLNAVLGFFSDLLADELYGPVERSPATLRPPRSHTHRRETLLQTNQRTSCGPFPKSGEAPNGARPRDVTVASSFSE